MGDFISILHDDILFHIFSSLPFESARQTIFLSKRWRLLWDRAIVRHGTKDDDAAGALSDFIANFDERCPSKNTRKLQFHFSNGSLILAIVAPGNKLHLDLSTGLQEFPTKFDLNLEFNDQNLSNQPSPSAFFVKTLHLRSVSCLTSEAVSSILTNFRFIETLKITRCKFLQSLSVGSDTKLLNLTIFDCPLLEFLQIRSFKLQSFRHRGLLPWIWPESHFNLADALLDYREGPSNGSFTAFTSYEFDYVLLAIKNVTVLTLCKWTFQVLICPSLSTFLTDFQFYYLKELWWIDNPKGSGYDGYALISFLRLCPLLEQLFVTIDSKSYSPESKDGNLIHAGRNTQLHHLKLVRLEGFANPADEILLAERIASFVTSDPLVLASADGICFRRLIKVPSYQSKQNRIGNAERVVPAESEERTCYYEYVHVKDVNELLPSTKHIHMSL